jgi:hypothetical protein
MELSKNIRWKLKGDKLEDVSDNLSTSPFFLRKNFLLVFCTNGRENSFVFVSTIFPLHSIVGEEFLYALQKKKTRLGYHKKGCVSEKEKARGF